jgi:2-polyprenyl-6-methoxyphenol hydroxylase-like FAD-dependent oxidoreductase
MTILIAGGGVGGLTLALMLHRRGIPAMVFEAAAEMRPLGVGINTLPHSIRELAALDLLPALDAVAIRTRQLTYMTHRGQTIWSEPRGLFAGHDVPQFSVHRGRLQQVLWRAACDRLGEGRLRCGQRLAGYEQHGDGVIARFAAPDGAITEVVGTALIGADGIHSWLRAHLHPDDGGIRWNGIRMWRGATDWPAFDGGDAMLIAGDAVVKLVLYPIASGLTPETRLTNWVIYASDGDPATPPPGRESWSRRGAYGDFRHLVERLSLPFIDAAALIQATPDIFEYPMCDRDPLPWWTQGRVTLLGDAAHPMYPVGSNGASQAVLDARCLSDLLERMEVPAALAAYAAERRPATTKIVHANRVGGPERVIDLIAGRAPDGFSSIADVATNDELTAIVKGYAQLAGFAVQAPATLRHVRDDRPPAASG